jgi:hypothetical protein
MTLSLKESQAVADLAEHLYDYLPGSGNPKWKGHVSFKTVSEKVGLDVFWQPGSKLPMIINLLEKTLDQKRSLFERLILEIVKSGITYRKKQKNPITTDDIDILNGLILEVGFKFPDLWDPDFYASLRIDGEARGKINVEAINQRERLKEKANYDRINQLDEIKRDFFSLYQFETNQEAGFKFEKILNKLFALQGLSPRESFRVVGEQIDGSFELDHETYLVEAKWTKDPMPEAQLLTFRGKIEGKSAYTRGVFISLNGISDDAKVAITQGKQPTFFAIDGYDLTNILSGEIELINFLRQRRRILAEEGAVAVPFTELWKGSRRK